LIDSCGPIAIPFLHSSMAHPRDKNEPLEKMQTDSTADAAFTRMQIRDNNENDTESESEREEEGGKRENKDAGSDSPLQDDDSDEEDVDEEGKHEPGIVEELPEGWYRGGSQPGKYKMGLDERYFRSGSASAYIESVGPNNKLGFGTVCQNFYPKDYLAKRVRLFAWLRYNLCEDSQSWTGIWMKVEIPTEGGTGFRLDNMSDRKLQGSSKEQWARAEIVMDIPMSCINCTFGFLLYGGGIVWADDFQFEVVDKSVPLTGVPNQKIPINLSFQQQQPPQEQKPHST